jgi:hypothetical protein
MLDYMKIARINHPYFRRLARLRSPELWSTSCSPASILTVHHSPLHEKPHCHIAIVLQSAMSTLAELDARIRTLEDELIRLKVSRNAHAPLFRLPDEVLVKIAGPGLLTNETHAQFRAVVIPPPALYALSAVCARLRAVLTGAPALWAAIDFRWAAHRIACHLGRARTHPLHCQVVASEPHPRLARCLQNARAVGAIRSPAVLALLKDTAAPAMRALWARDVRAWRVDETSLHPSIAAGLATLHLDGASVARFPVLPALRSLTLRSLQCGVDALAGLLASSPGLASVTLANACSDARAPTQGAAALARLPDLRALTIDDNCAAREVLLSILPNPSRHFEVNMHAMARARTGTGRSIVDLAMHRMAQFWSGKAHTVSACTVTSRWGEAARGSSELVEYHAAESPVRDGGMSASCAGAGQIRKDEPFLAAVRTLRLEGWPVSVLADAHDGEPTGAHPRLNWFPAVEHLVLQWRPFDQVQLHGPRAGGELEDWIAARSREGRPLRSIKIVSPPTAFGAIQDRLFAGRFADTIEVDAPRD